MNLPLNLRDCFPVRNPCPAWVRSGLLIALLSGTLPAANTFIVHNLVSDLPNTADRTDPNLVNAWGLASSPGSPLWTGNNHTGTSTLYTGAGAIIPLVVTIPTPGATPGQGAVTGVIFNGTKSFAVTPGNPSSFMFCSEDGTILGWNATADATHAKILVDNSAMGAVYKGCTIAGPSDAPIFYAANFNAGTVDMYDGNFQRISILGAFQDTHLPAGFAPFNIQWLSGKLYVTYAMQDSAKMDDVRGAGNGYVDVYDTSGTLLSRLIAKGPLNSPWGLAIAPAGFGDFANDLLVANFGDGAINAFDPASGALIGTLNGTNGKPISIPGIWGLLFGNGHSGGDALTLYFTAGSPGPNGEPLESHGLLGSIQPAPVFAVSGVQNGASFDSTIAPNTFATIKGNALSATTRTWLSKDFTGNQLPTTLDGVGVTINGEAAYVSYISPSQINFLVPPDIASGPAQVQVTSGGLTSATATVNVQSVAPAFFSLGGTKYIAATHTDGVSLVAPKGLITNLNTTPAVTGETIVLYANGLGATTTPVTKGQVLAAPLALATLPVVTIGGVPAQVTFAGLSSTGLYQLNVVVPAGVPSGDAAVMVQTNGVWSPANAFISVASAPVPSAVAIMNFSFNPTPITISAGGQVAWTNDDAVQHTVVGDANQFASAPLSKGATFTQEFDTPGTYTYHCSIHPNMKATLVVK